MRLIVVEHAYVFGLCGVCICLVDVTHANVFDIGGFGIRF